MTKLQIRMRQVDQVKDFVDLLSKYPYEMDLVSGRYTIDAKSLLGIYSLDLSNPLPFAPFNSGSPSPESGGVLICISPTITAFP